MLIRAGHELVFECARLTPMVLILKPHPSRHTELVKNSGLTFKPSLDSRDYTDVFGNTCTRIVAAAGLTTVSSDFVVWDRGYPDSVALEAVQAAVDDLPDEILSFLLPSRYCETDLLGAFAWSKFGDTRPGWQRVQAICDFVHEHLAFSYANADSWRTAYDAYLDKVGVCRDFAHLAITFCRCMNIPARYCTGYLGDIGVPPGSDPMDFSAWFEVYLDGRWFAFDPRHNRPRIGRVLIATGRDAADVAISTSFGQSRLSRFSVFTYELPSSDGKALRDKFSPTSRRASSTSLRSTRSTDCRAR